MDTKSAAALVAGSSLEGATVEVQILVGCVAGGRDRTPGEICRLPRHEAQILLGIATPRATLDIRRKPGRPKKT